MKSYAHLAARIFNTPLLIHPGKLDAIIAGLGSRLLGVGIEAASAPSLPVDAAGEMLPADLFTTRRGEWKKSESGFYALQEGVAVVSAFGALAHRTTVKADSSMILGYEQIMRNLEAAASDTDAHAIVLLMDSPGGEVAGAFEAAAQVREIAARKPVHAIADSLAASAGYLLASAARTVSVAPTGYVGSIGVVMTHVDLSRALANDGIAVTHLYAGAHKIDGTPYQPLPAETRARFQSEIDALYEQFITAVAQTRGLDPAAVRATQAALFRAERALAVGLADRVLTPDALIAELAASRPRTYPVGQPARATVTSGDSSMSDISHAGAPTQSATPITQVDLDAALTLGAEAERQRIFAILDSAAAQDHPQAALALARKPQIDAQTASEVLAALPAEILTLEATEHPSTFERHMAALGNPRLGLDDDPDPGHEARALWDHIVARYQ